MVRLNQWSTYAQIETIIGFCIGIFITSRLGQNTIVSQDGIMQPCNETKISKVPQNTEQRMYEQSKENLVFVGVMTADKFLDSRAVAVYETWGKSIPGNMAFFTSENSHANPNIPVVRLAGVDDVYPPQKKSFLMLKYMHDHHINDYEWFMRADDDLYVRTDKLGRFLRSVNSDTVQFLGQPGIGSKANRENLKLGADDNYCMGGPGMVFSRHTLKKVVPHIKECLQNLYTPHEDVEIGRCIRKFSNITCTWAYEMQQLFYHNQSQENAFSGRLRQPEVLGAITLHPLKSPTKMYRMHNYFTAIQIKDINHKMLMLRREISNMKSLLSNDDRADTSLEFESSSKPSLTSYTPSETDDILTWKMFDQTMYSDDTENPHFRIEKYQHTAIYDNIMDLLMHIQQYNQQRGRTIAFKSLLYGYFRVNPLHGINYVLDVLLNYNRYQGKRILLRVRRHAYVQQTFLSSQVREITPNFQISSEISNVRVSLVLPLAGRQEILKRFMENYEAVCLQNRENVELLIVLFTADDAVDSEYLNFVYNLVNDLNREYDTTSIRIHELDRNFSRGLALNSGAKLHSDKSLLVFLDVDMIFDSSFIDRVRRNTVYNSSAYFPIVYSQYKPDSVQSDKKSENVYNFDEDVGFWRRYGFGIASIFKMDFDRAKGFNETIVGWGLEDVDFFEKVMGVNLTLFRSADPGIIHIYHEPSCESGKSALQSKNCLGTVMSTLGSAKSLVDKLKNFL